MQFQVSRISRHECSAEEWQLASILQPHIDWQSCMA